jgi:hypothetical protein
MLVVQGADIVPFFMCKEGFMNPSLSLASDVMNLM